MTLLMEMIWTIIYANCGHRNVDPFISFTGYFYFSYYESIFVINKIVSLSALECCMAGVGEEGEGIIPALYL